MTINKIVSNTLLYFKETKEVMTPDLYAKKFCEFAKKERLDFDECNKLEKYSQKLDPDIKKLLLNYSIKSLDDFIYFLTVQLNRQEKSKNKELLNSLQRLASTLLKTIRLLHNAEASKISEAATGSDLRIPSFVDKANETFKNFNDSYNISFLDGLSRFGIFTKSDFPSLVKELIKELEQRGDANIGDDFARILIMALTPSISTSVNDKIAKLESQLIASPELITSQEVKEELSECVLKRIADDNHIFFENLKNTNQVLDSLLEKITSIISLSREKSEETTKIKETLKSIDFENSDVHSVQKRLIEISEQIETNINNFSKSLDKEHAETEELKKRITELENELAQARKEANEDFLTSTVTRRSLSKQLEIFENGYKDGNKNYSVIFFDIDHFKKVNDTYGHVAGDKILAAVGKFINEHVDSNDIVGRYGGEEFIILSDKNMHEELFDFADSLRKKIENAKFMHQKDEIHITCSAGIAIRDEHPSQEKTIKKADLMLYEAKKAGRNQIFPKQQ